MEKIVVSALTKTCGPHANVIVTPIVVTNFHDKTKSKNSQGIWDTGATNSCITKDLANELGLCPVQKVPVSGVFGMKPDVPVYYINVTLNNKDISLNIRVTECDRLSNDPTENIGMLIGMDVIGLGDFTISNFQGNTVMSFRRPSCGTTDYVRLLQVHNPAKSTKIGPNDPCPCGSGLKYKKCCGKK